jgi:hypothetical protein
MKKVDLLEGKFIDFGQVETGIISIEKTIQKITTNFRLKRIEIWMYLSSKSSGTVSCWQDGLDKQINLQIYSSNSEVFLSDFGSNNTIVSISDDGFLFNNYGNETNITYKVYEK